MVAYAPAGLEEEVPWGEVPAACRVPASATWGGRVPGLGCAVGTAGGPS